MKKCSLNLLIITKPSNIQTRICLPLKLFYDAFDETHSHGHSGEKLSNKFFSHFTISYICPRGFLSSFMIALKARQKNFPIKPNNISPHLPCFENNTQFIYRITMDTKGQIFSFHKQLLHFCKT